MLFTYQIKKEADIVSTVVFAMKFCDAMLMRLLFVFSDFYFQLCLIYTVGELLKNKVGFKSYYLFKNKGLGFAKYLAIFILTLTFPMQRKDDVKIQYKTRNNWEERKALLKDISAKYNLYSHIIKEI